MKRLILILTLFVFSMSVVFAEGGGMRLQISAGLAFPNKTISQFFDDAKQQPIPIDSIKGLGDYILEKASTLGYTINIKGRIELSKHFTLLPGIGIARFNRGKYIMDAPTEVKEQSDTAHLAINSVANVVPISLGLSGYLFKSFISPYFVVELAYNYTAYSYDGQVEWADSLSIPLALSSTSSYLGYGLGAGIDIDLKLITLNTELKYNMINLIKSNSDEPVKKHITLIVGVVF